MKNEMLNMQECRTGSGPETLTRNWQLRSPNQLIDIELDRVSPGHLETVLKHKIRKHYKKSKKVENKKPLVYDFIPHESNLR